MSRSTGIPIKVDGECISDIFISDIYQDRAETHWLSVSYTYSTTLGQKNKVLNSEEYLISAHQRQQSNILYVRNKIQSYLLIR